MKFLNAVKKIIEAHKNVNLLFLVEPYMLFENYKIVCNNDVILVATGADKTIPAISITKNKIIFVNDAFKKLSQRMQEALFQHEIGHSELKHLG